MATAIEAGASWLDQAAALRQRLEAAIVALGGQVIANDSERIASIGAYRMPGVSAAAQMIRFDAAGIAVSAGSACSSGSLRQSHVLTAMQVEGAGEVIRVSLGHETLRADIERFIDTWRTIARRDTSAGTRAA
jgi:cysteine desulfurase